MHWAGGEMTDQDVFDIGKVAGFLILMAFFGFAAAEIASGWLS